MGDRNGDRLVDKEWSNIFGDYPIMDKIEENGYCIITSTLINNYREVRLMTKFDHKSNLPDKFYENDLSILPITRGSYIISKFDAYKKLNVNHKIKPKRTSIPKWVQSISKNEYS